MGVPHCAVAVSVAHHRRNSGKRNAGIRRSRSKRVPQVVKPKALDACLFTGTVESRLNIAKSLAVPTGGEKKTRIQGETGTGKELAARAVHKLSHRRNGAFITRGLRIFRNWFGISLRSMRSE